ncbi:MAG: UDP-N-acetylmuramoyl-tripeptide--D-alanyl-D-alanine ligase [Geobacter sp.]|nr:UDP-N-acetylmuramoyl-tripeptide--D-alanyl-D-alanine ligase [Geobacter sp.]
MFSVRDIVEATGGVLRGDAGLTVTGVSTDSRSIEAGELLVALRGERFNGHDYIQQTLASGVRAFIVAADWLAKHDKLDGSYIAVPDTLRALGDLAAWHRRRFDIPVIGITGSNGKTTTKEMLASILEQQGAGLKTSGNLNNLIGMPQMLFRLSSEHKWAVLEMGMSEFGEIDRLAEIAAPGIGIVTNAFPAHLETMGSVEGVARAKGELFQRLPAGGFAVYNADDPLISRLPSPEGVQRISFGLHGADVTAHEIRQDGRRGQRFVLRTGGEETEITLHAFGEHNIYNALAASAAARAVGAGIDAVRAGLESFRPYDKRFQVEELDDLVLIDDSYNANPASMRAALTTLRTLKEECRGIAVLGDMLELGPGSAAAHRELGRLAAECVERLYLFGDMAADVAAGAKVAGLPRGQILVASSHREIVEDLEKSRLPGDCVLVKGSRGMRMETVAIALRERYSKVGSN